MAKVKPRTNRIKATFWTEDGMRSDIDADCFKKEHHFAIYKLLTGGYRADQIARVHAILDEVAT